VSSVRCSASAFIQPSISTSPLAASVVMQGISPSAPNFGANSRPSSTCSMDRRS
jgi:hypothetical protein